MINSFVTEKKEDGKSEVCCFIKGTVEDFAVEYEAIIRAIAKDRNLLNVADMVMNKMIAEKIPDCFRPKSDSIEEFFNNIIKGEEEND